jgi:sRNA-binding protein
MTTKLFAVVLLALALAACDSSSTPESTTNANRSSSPNTAASPASNAAEQATPAATTPSAAQIKAGDKVKVTIAGKASDATVVSVDEKSAKVVVKMSGGEEKTVPLGDVTKQ